MCDLSYAIQIERIRAAALSEMQLAPYAEEGQQIDTPDAAAAEFDQWVHARPVELDRDDDDTELRTLIGVR